MNKGIITIPAEAYEEDGVTIKALQDEVDRLRQVVNGGIALLNHRYEDIAKLRAQNESLLAGLREYISGCVNLCNDKKDCGYEGYRRRCPACPMYQSDEIQVLIDRASEAVTEVRDE